MLAEVQACSSRAQVSIGQVPTRSFTYDILVKMGTAGKTDQ